jgi:hypothetical protein
MIPFSTWSLARGDRNDPIAQQGSAHPYAVDLVAIEVEVNDLVDALVDNLMTASVAQLRGVLESSGKTWSEQQAEKHNLQLEQEMTLLEDRIISAVTDSLLPVLSDVQLRDVMNDFAAVLQKLLPEFGAQKLRVTAPTDMHDILQRALQTKAINAEIVECDRREVIASSERVTLAANLDEWSQKIRRLVSA